MKAKVVIPEKGLIRDLPREDYDKLQRVNWSRLKILGRSAAHFRHNMLTPSEDTDPRRLGRATHLAALEPEKFASTCVVWKGGARRGKEWADFLDEHDGLEVLTEGQHQRCMDIQRAVHGSSMAKRYLGGGSSEVTAIWTHKVEAIAGLPGFTIPCKARLDFEAREARALVDLKTTRDASPDAFGKQCATLQYYVQAAWYRDGYEAATGEMWPYVLIAVESEPPHVVQVYTVNEQILELGRDIYRGLLERLHQCRSTSKWVGYADEPLELTLPRWMAPKEEEGLDGLGLVTNQQSEDA